jgi:hypothetical protein
MNNNPNETQAASQSQQILELLLSGVPLTVLEALEYLDCYALSQRISEIRRKGFPIQDRWIKTNSGKLIKQYTL